MKKTYYECDRCHQEIKNTQFLNNIMVIYYQGEPHVEKPDKFKNVWVKEYWKHKVAYQGLVCCDCMGCEVDHNYGDNNSGVNFDFWGFLRKFGFIKN